LLQHSLRLRKNHKLCGTRFSSPGSVAKTEGLLIVILLLILLALIGLRLRLRLRNSRLVNITVL
jgi:hypothetical protein